MQLSKDALKRLLKILARTHQDGEPVEPSEQWRQQLLAAITREPAPAVKTQWPRLLLVVVLPAALLVAVLCWWLWG